MLALIGSHHGHVYLVSHTIAQSVNTTSAIKSILRILRTGSSHVTSVATV